MGYSDPAMVQHHPVQRWLLTWSDRGTDGPVPSHHSDRPVADRGPVMRLLEHTEGALRYQRAVVLTVPGGRRRAQQLAAEIAAHVAAVEVRELVLADPSDYSALFGQLAPLVRELERSTPPASWQCDVLLSAGTPQAQTLWVILVQAAMLRARMLQVIPSAFVPHPHPHPIRQVDLEIEGFPDIRVLREEVARLRAQVRARRPSLVATSEPMRTLMAQVTRVAASELPVLIAGETGAGKELIARAIHEGGPRASGPFVAENCGALADGVLASELFGHEAAAFTGAGKLHRGLFEQAHGGTVFLDEVGELSPHVQAMLLRVLQERSLRRVGGERMIAVDVRVIAATHRDLAQRVREGSFREDLYYRLRGVMLRVPPLRERTADLPDMIAAFQRELGNDRGQRPLPVSAAAMRLLAAYPWPGNVRQLRSEVQRWAVFCDHTVDVADLAPEIQVHRGDPVAATSRLRPGLLPSESLPEASLEIPSLAETVQAAERSAIEHAVAFHAGNLARSAAALGIERNTLKRKLRKLGRYPWM